MRSIVVTGAGRGLGKAITKVLLQEGYHVIATDISMPELKEMKNEMVTTLGIPGQRMDLIEFDLRDINNIGSLVNSVKDCLNEWNPLWGYVNNAGIFLGSSKGSSRLLDISVEDMDDIVKVNMMSAFLLSREMFKIIREAKRGGSIVFISSIASERGSLRNPVYGMTKSAIANLAKSIASEGGSENIRANAISPGIIETQMGFEVFPSKELLQKRIEQNLIKRACTIEEVAHLVKYLLSDYAGYITGVNIDISGGHMIK